MKIQLAHKFEDIISLENLLLAWQKFIRSKRNKKDVQDFSLNLMDNIFSLHSNINNHTYKYGGYQAFKINDPGPRDILLKHCNGYNIVREVKQKLIDRSK